MKDMKETRKMLEYYKTSFRVESFCATVGTLFFVIFGTIMMFLLWWVGLILLGIGAICAVLVVIISRKVKQIVERLEKELAEAEQALKDSESKEE